MIKTTLTRRGALTAFAALSVVSVAGHGETASLPTIRVTKDPSCGCCGGWVDHLRAAGFPVEVNDTPEIDRIKARLGVRSEEHTSELQSHHDLVCRLLLEKKK